jgi:benzoyl-CoA reductase/2-hydroxyglutaryl-CoA dehydratase subunit BcrC/BadD/HgdB
LEEKKGKNVTINTKSYILLCDDEVDNKAKIYETLDERRICCVNVGIHRKSPTWSSWKKKE